MTDKNKINFVKDKLKNLLLWSDRLGSDEIYDIQESIKILEE